MSFNFKLGIMAVFSIAAILLMINSSNTGAYQLQSECMLAQDGKTYCIPLVDNQFRPQGYQEPFVPSSIQTHGTFDGSRHWTREHPVPERYSPTYEKRYIASGRGGQDWKQDFADESLRSD